ncbi:MAG: ATP-binding cassette domain-containing protein [Lachnospiraceae bacterium]|nr:ATP-binding cassette domain-containing protein [Lachnospiraceae bacterium]
MVFREEAENMPVKNMKSEYIVQTNQLTKIVDGRDIVKEVNIHVKKGEIYGFLGPNGAGKTTVMKMLTNLWKPTFGTVELFGETLTPTSYEVLKRMGSIIEFPCFYEHMSGRENLQLHCEYMGYYVPDSVDHALEMLGLLEAGNQQVRRYSLGMKQRLGIARAILCRPELLVLDEPTNGLDPAGMKQLRDLFQMLCAEYGITIILSSHILSEVESIADTIGVIDHGTLRKEISMQEISEKNTAYIELAVEDTKKASYVLADKLELKNFKVVDGSTIRIYDDGADTGVLSKTLALNDIAIQFIGRKSESLEDYFLKVTGEGSGL